MLVKEEKRAYNNSMKIRVYTRHSKESSITLDLIGNKERRNIEHENSGFY